jgi:hypothetical protein
MLPPWAAATTMIAVANEKKKLLGYSSSNQYVTAPSRNVV